jgi:hypothetical protein
MSIRHPYIRMASRSSLGEGGATLQHASPADLTDHSIDGRRGDATLLPKVSVVIVNWNRLNDVLDNLKYLRGLEYPNLEIIVVDNGSTDGSPERLEREPDVRLVRLSENTGPSRGRNAGFRIARGKYVLLIDSDAYMTRPSLRRLVDRMEADPQIGAAGCKVLNWHTRKIDQWIYAQPYDRYRDKSFDTYAFSAAGVLIRNDVLRSIGGFWERLFIYNEEVDLSIRILRAGYRIIYEPTARVFHRPATTGRANKANYFRLQIRNWIWIYFRHYPAPLAWWKASTYSALYLIKGLTNRQLRACATGIVEGLRNRHAGDALEAADFEEKMTLDQARHIASLNRRLGLRLWKLAPEAVQRPARPTPPPAPLARPAPAAMELDEDEVEAAIGR